jgi:hypothetical protein
VDVRHINHIKDDNRIENLFPMNRRGRFVFSAGNAKKSNEQLRLRNNSKITKIEIPLEKLELINRIQKSKVAMTIKEDKVKDLVGGLCCICREIPTKQITYDMRHAIKIERYCDECIERSMPEEGLIIKDFR